MRRVLNRSLLSILCCITVLALGSCFELATTSAAGNHPVLDGNIVLEKMATQFSLARDLTGTVTVSVREGEVGFQLIGDLKVKGRDHVRLDYLAPDASGPATIISDGDLVAYYLPGSTRPRIVHDPTQLGFPLLTDLVLAALDQVAQIGQGQLLGEDEYLDRAVYMVEIRPLEIPELWESTVFWIDAISWLPLRVTGLGTPFTSVEFKATAVEENANGQITKMTAEVIEIGPETGKLIMELVRFNDNVWFPRHVCVRSAEFAIRQEFSDLQFNVSLADELFYVEEFEVLRSAFAKGTAFLTSRNYPAAVKEFQRIVAIDPYNVLAHSNLGYAYVGSGDEAGAIAEFEQVIMLAPDEPLGYNNLAYIYIDNGIYLEKAMEMARKAVELSPGNGAFRDTLGWAYYRLGDFEAAIEEFALALELMGSEDRPWDRALVHYHLAMAYGAESRWVKAQEHLAKALDLDPSLEEAREELKKIEKKIK
ncbi:MAG: tetratricopeptide repeat protein [Firmicutes bacterium]|nr:tetratricopeptide repeat protein [Bacillota bacterium]